MGDNTDICKSGGNRDNIKARIFIGNLPQTGIDKKDLEDIFCNYGKILGINMLRTFAFVQYDNEGSAIEAIKGETGRVMQNRKLDIKPALRGKQKSPERGGSAVRERSPLDSGDDRRGTNRLSRGGGLGLPVGRETGDWREPDRFDPGFPLRSRSGIDDPYPSTEYPLGIGNGPYGDAKPASAYDFPTAMPVTTAERSNDCEIIVVNKSVTEYAEFIEHKLKKLGLTVDLLFPNEDVPLGRVLANISGRGSLYAIIVTAQNEEHRSLTLNILHGQHQEHRNMPTEDSINLIIRDFELYLRGERAGINHLGSPLDKHPEAIQTLLNLLHQNRQLTVLQYDKTIRYLQEKREIQVKIELGDAKDAPSTGNHVVPPAKQAELQNRIMNILSKTGGANSSDGSPASAKPMPHWGGGGPTSLPPAQNQGGPSAAGGPPPLLNDPTVQKALDNLMQGNLLKKINTGGPAPVPAPQPLFSAYGSGRKY